MRVYRERLGVPLSWWLTGAGCGLIMATTLWAGFSVAIGAAVYAGTAALLALGLLSWGSITIEVTGSEVIAGPRRLALSQLGEVSALDATQSAALRGPRADPAAYLLIRPYLPESVYLEVTGQAGAEPYWLIGSRHPADFAAAIQTARSPIEQPATWND